MGVGIILEQCILQAMIIDGRAVAQTVLQNTAAIVKALPAAPVLTVFTCAPTFETQKFLALKRQKAEQIGITVRVVEFSVEATVPEIVMSIQAAHRTSSGIIVQLPFPPQVDIEEVLPAILPSHDVDVLTYDGSTTTVLPPVAGAIAAICQQENIPVHGANVLVIGQGRLVGVPVSIYMRQQGARVTVVTKDSTDDMTALARTADIIVSGAGVPGLVTAAMVSPGTVVFDAGTSEDNGTLVGDVDPFVAEKCHMFTPVPGGIGPITVAILLQNVARLAQAQIEKTSHL